MGRRPAPLTAAHEPGDEVPTGGSPPTTETPMTDLAIGDTVRHDDGREGTVTAMTGKRVSVKFPGHWRTSVVFAKSLSKTPAPVEAPAGE